MLSDTKWKWRFVQRLLVNSSVKGRDTQVTITSHSSSWSVHIDICIIMLKYLTRRTYTGSIFKTIAVLGNSSVYDTKRFIVSLRRTNGYFQKWWKKFRDSATPMYTITVLWMQAVIIYFINNLFVKFNILKLYYWCKLGLWIKFAMSDAAFCLIETKV